MGMESLFTTEFVVRSAGKQPVDIESGKSDEERNTLHSSLEKGNLGNFHVGGANYQ